MSCMCCVGGTVCVYWECLVDLSELCLSGGAWSPSCFVMGINCTEKRHTEHVPPGKCATVVMHMFGFICK